MVLSPSYMSCGIKQISSTVVSTALQLTDSTFQVVSFVSFKHFLGLLHSQPSLVALQALQVPQQNLELWFWDLHT